MNTTHRTPTFKRQQGVTLIELMIALLLSLLLVAGMIQIFAGNRATYEFNQGLSRIQENARFSLDHIAYTARMAGYSGCLSDVAFHNNLDIDVADEHWYDIQDGVRGHNANNTAENDDFSAGSTNPAPSGNPTDWSPPLPPELNGKVIPGSDVLIVRGIAPNAQQLVTPFSDSAQLFVAEPSIFLEGEILIVSDCQKASLFQATEVQPAGGKVNVVHSNAGTFTPGNVGPNWGPEQEFGLGAELARLQVHAFYVGEGASGGPALFQRRLTGGAFGEEELVEGIDTMQVRYGIDNDDDGAVDDWLSADVVGDWTRILVIEVSMLARTPDEYGTEWDTADYTVGGMTFDPAPDAGDRRLRQVFSTTIGVRNRLP